MEIYSSALPIQRPRSPFILPVFSPPGEAWKHWDWKQVSGQIHPLFAREQFPKTIEYRKMVKDWAVLASRLLATPQSEHYFYTLYFGKNTKVDSRPEASSLPEQCASAKGINDLTAEDKIKVRERLTALAKRVRFEFEDLKGGEGLTRSQKSQPGVRGRDSVIVISKPLYDAAMKKKGRMEEDNALIGFWAVTTILHEVAHAACFDIFGPNQECYFETSTIAEAGYELESRLFGACPDFDLNDLYEANWYTWQTEKLNSRAYPLKKICRCRAKLPKTKSEHLINSDFALKLFDDDFWRDDYAVRGAVALIPWSVAEAILLGGRGNFYKAIPNTIKELYGVASAKNARRKYAHLTNDGYELRTPAKSEPAVKEEVQDASICFQ